MKNGILSLTSSPKHLLIHVTGLNFPCIVCSALCLYEQKSSDAIISSDKDDMKGGFVSAVLLPLAQGVLCVTADQRFLFYDLGENDEGKYDLNISKRLIGYNEEIVDLKFLGEEEKFLAVATNLEQV